MRHLYLNFVEQHIDQQANGGDNLNIKHKMLSPIFLVSLPLVVKYLESQVLIVLNRLINDVKHTWYLLLDLQ